MAFDYFYGAQSQQFAFYRIPKVMFTDNRFQNISTEGKVLYGLLLDRVSLSMENGWIDDEGRVYIIFTLTTIRQAMNCAEKSAIKYLTELEEFGLIERIRQGFGKPALIYVKNFIDQQNLQVRTSKNYSSPPVKVTGQNLCEFPYKSRVMGTSEPLKPLKAPYMARNPVKWGFFRLKGQEIPLKI